MAEYIKLDERYVPIEYLIRPVDSFWEFRETVELTLSGSFSEIKDFFKSGSWVIYREEYEWISEPTEEDEMAGRSELVYRPTDMSEYCVCGWVRDNMDGTITVKMGKMNDLEKFIESMLGGL